MQKKIIFLILSLVIIGTSIPMCIDAAELYNTHDLKENKINSHIPFSFSQPEISYDDNYGKVSVKETNNYYIKDENFILPFLTKTFTYPLGTKINKVTCEPLNIQKFNNGSYLIERISDFENNPEYSIEWMRSHIGVGIYNGERVLIATLQIFPVCYRQDTDDFLFSPNIDVTITYETSQYQSSIGEKDFLIISPALFQDELQPLIEHKENHDIRTFLKTTEEIYSEYTGVDKAEQIKYCIKDAIDTYNIHYVMLVGGMNHQRWWSWHIPVRYSNLEGNYGMENRYISDLYFADVYKYEGGQAVFDDWDSNDNNIFAEWTPDNKDVLDMYPDVCLGRLPCRTEQDVSVVVNKIINYENTAFGQEWFNRMVVIGGDNHNDNVSEFGYADYIEGQLTCDKALTFMDGFEKIRIYVEDGDLPLTVENMENVLSEGQGFVLFVGHGSPMEWGTHPYHNYSTWIYFKLRNILKLTNEEKLPVLLVSGCHNSQFDVSILHLLKVWEGKELYDYIYWGELSPVCWGWLFTRHEHGGSIATLGATGLDYGGSAGDGPFEEVPDSVPDGIPDVIQYLGGWLNPHFFEVYANGTTILGQTFVTSIIDYLNQFPIDWDHEFQEERPYTIDRVNCKKIQVWILFGDPTLQIGGYS